MRTPKQFFHFNHCRRRKRAYLKTEGETSTLSRSSALQDRSGVVPIHFSDEAEADFLGADGFAGAGHGAVAKTFGVHLADHAKRAAVFLSFALRQQIQV